MTRNECASCALYFTFGLTWGVTAAMAQSPGFVVRPAGSPPTTGPVPQTNTIPHPHPPAAAKPVENRQKGAFVCT